MDSYLFTSERLGFRLWQDSDLVPLSKLNLDPAVMAFFPSTQDAQMSKSFIKRQQTNFEQKGYCFYAVDELKSGAFIGFIGIQDIPYTTPFTPAVEIGWRLSKQYWNNGYASEGAKKCLKHAFDELGIQLITAMTAIINKPSEKVMQKIGMIRIGEFDHPKVPAESPLLRHCWYSIGRE